MSNPGISLTAPDDYVSQMAQAQRRQQLAQALSQAGNEPIQAQSAGGITAPISPLSVLAKALNSFGGAYESGQAVRAEAAARRADQDNATKAISNLYTLPAGGQAPNAGTVDTSGLPGAGPSFPITGQRNIEPTPTTPQQQLQMLAPLAGQGPTSQAIYSAAMPGVMANATLQQRIQTLQPQFDQMVSQMSPALRAGAQGLFTLNPEAGMQFAASHAASQLIPVTPDEYGRYGIDAKNIPPGTQIYRDPSTGKIEESKLGDVKSQGAQDQAIKTAEATTAARISLQNGAGVNPADPAIANFAANIHNGMASLRNIPTEYRKAVSNFIANEKDETGSPTTAALYAGAAKKLTEPYTSNPQYQLFANAQPYLQRMNAAAGMKSSIGDTDLLDSLVKLETGGNAITDAQVLTSINGQSVADRMDVLKNKLVAQGGVLSDAQRNEALQLGNKIYSNYKTGYQPLYETATKQLTAAHIPNAYWTIPDLNQFGGTGGGQQNFAPAGTKAVGPGGKTLTSDGKGGWK